MAQDTPSRSTPAQQQEPEPPAAGAERPPGEIGGHTVQPWEQDPVPPTTTPNSKDVPPPEMGTKEARAAGPGAGAKTTEAPGNQPSGASPGHAAPPEPAAESELPPSLTRPSRPPVYKPQNGHEPAPRPPPAQATQAKATGPATDGDALVESITKAIAENLAKALHQSIAQAVRESMPLSGRTLASPGPKVEVSSKLVKAPAKPKPDAKATAKPEPAIEPAAESAPAAQAKAQPAPAPAAAAQGERPSQFGGTIEAPDGEAKAKLAAAGQAPPAAEAGDDGTQA